LTSSLNNKSVSQRETQGSGKAYNLVYYESRKRELERRPIYECRYDERLRTKVEKSTCLTYTGLKIKTRLIDEMFASVMGEHVFLKR
jgi:hypothetical protein